MRIVPGVCAILMLTTAQAHAQAAPVPLPSGVPAKVEEVKANWAYLGQSAGLIYVEQAGQTVKGKRIAWDAVILAEPIAINERLILGYYYLRQYDCAGRRERLLYWARLADTDVRWNQTRPSPWTSKDEFMADIHTRRFETICGPEAP